MRSGISIAEGRYELISSLGRGGMGEVWKATDSKLGDRTVAVKFVRRTRPDAKVRFAAEVSAHAQMSHPNIVTCHDSGTERIDGYEVDYLVMEFLDSPTLTAALRDGGRASPEDAVDFACSLLSALAHIHDQGLVHRDIKPSNIMFARNRGFILMDFGIARQAAHDTTVTHAGTPGYWAPEQSRPGRTIDGRADIYSLGLVLLDFLLGFGHSPEDQAHIPAPLRRVIASMTALDVDDRPRDARTCRRLLRDSTVSAKSTTAEPRSTEPSDPAPDTFLPREFSRLDLVDWDLIAMAISGVAWLLLAAGSGWLGTGITSWSSHIHLIGTRGTSGWWFPYAVGLLLFLAALIAWATFAETLWVYWLTSAIGVGAVCGDAYELAVVEHASAWLRYGAPAIPLFAAALGYAVYFVFDRADLL